MSDIDLIAEVLCEYRSLCLSHRYGGLGDRLPRIKEALDALKRVAQPSFLSAYPKSEKPQEDEHDEP